MPTISEIRALDARTKSDFYAGRSDQHPHGASGLRFLLPRELTSNTRDTAPHAADLSEWGNACGWDNERWVSRPVSRITRTRRELGKVVHALEQLRERIAKAR